MKTRTVYVFDLEWTLTSAPVPAWCRSIYRLAVIEPDNVETAFEMVRSQCNTEIANRILEGIIDANEYIRETLRINRVFLEDEISGRYPFGALAVLRIEARNINVLEAENG